MGFGRLSGMNGMESGLVIGKVASGETDDRFSDSIGITEIEGVLEAALLAIFFEGTSISRCDWIVIEQRFWVLSGFHNERLMGNSFGQNFNEVIRGIDNDPIRDTG